MEDLNNKINQDLITALKESNDTSLRTIRLIKNSIKNEQIKIGHQLKNSEIIKLLIKEVKQREQSILAYQKANRNDLVTSEKNEIEIINKYLPELLNENEIKQIVDRVISEEKELDKTKIGTIIAKSIKLAEGKADNSVIAKIVKEKLDNK